jgi:hypothetical protein
MPLFGWSSYEPEGAYISCSVDWYTKSFNVISYNVTTFSCVFFIPLCVLLFTNTQLIAIVSSIESLRASIINEVITY